MAEKKSDKLLFRTHDIDKKNPKKDEPIIKVNKTIELNNTVVVKDNRSLTDEVAGKVIKVTYDEGLKQFSILLDTGYTIEIGSE